MVKVKTYCLYHVATGKVYFFRAFNKPKKDKIKRVLKINKDDFVTIDRIKVLDLLSIL